VIGRRPITIEQGLRPAKERRTKRGENQKDCHHHRGKVNRGKVLQRDTPANHPLDRKRILNKPAGARPVRICRHSAKEENKRQTREKGGYLENAGVTARGHQGGSPAGSNAAHNSRSDGPKEGKKGSFVRRGISDAWGGERKSQSHQRINRRSASRISYAQYSREAHNATGNSERMAMGPRHTGSCTAKSGYKTTRTLTGARNSTTNSKGGTEPLPQALPKKEPGGKATFGAGEEGHLILKEGQTMFPGQRGGGKGHTAAPCGKQRATPPFFPDDAWMYNGKVYNAGSTTRGAGSYSAETQLPQ